MKDKFEILQALIEREVSDNHFGIYISIGQFGRLMAMVSLIYSNWNDSETMEANIDRYYERSIGPLGNGGTNRI